MQSQLPTVREAYPIISTQVCWQYERIKIPSRRLTRRKSPDFCGGRSLHPKESPSLSVESCADHFWLQLVRGVGFEPTNPFGTGTLQRNDGHPTLLPRSVQCTVMQESWRTHGPSRAFCGLDSTSRRFSELLGHLFPRVPCSSSASPTCWASSDAPR